MPGYLPKPPVCILNRAHPLARGLVAAWPFDEGGGGKTVRDAVGSNHGTAQAYNKWTGGAFGHCMAFNGTNDYVSVADSASLDGMANITIAFWGKASTFSDNAYPVGKRASYEFLANGGKLKAGVNSGDWVYATTATSITTGVWFHATVTYDGSNVKIYYNGSLEDTQPQSGLVANNTNPLGLGFLLNPAVEGYQFNGSIDDVRIYNRALSAAEVAAVYADPWAIYRPLRDWLKVALMGAWWHRNMIRDRRSGVR